MSSTLSQIKHKIRNVAYGGLLFVALRAAGQEGNRGQHWKASRPPRANELRNLGGEPTTGTLLNQCKL